MEYLRSIFNEALQRRGDLSGDSASKKTPNPLTYPKASEPFSIELFKHPTTEYRGCPLWSWNTKLEKGQLLRQIDNYEAMGLGGFHMHVRTGLDTEYMGTEFMDLVRDCVEYAESKNMMACLYDDDRWPSGAAGGLVTKNYPEHRAKHILFTPRVYGKGVLDGDRAPTSARACRSELGYLLASYDIELDENGCLKSSRVLKEGETGNNVWYAYVETNPGSPWFNGQTYIDTLSVPAMSKFIESTHEVYKGKIGDKFGTTVPCIFTDEPQFATKTQLDHPRADNDCFLPWTTDINDSFKKEYGADLVEGLPEIFWDLPAGKPSLTRYRWHDHTCERFVTAFMDQLSTWCRKNSIILNGHMMEEPTLYSQTTALGEVMRAYRNQEMPGMDLLCDWVEYTTAKQCSSVSRQNGTRGTMTEIYGVTHWYFTFEGHKGCGDWQAALGITFRVQHLTWVSMAGEGKRDYPACIGYQSPWFKEYGYVEDHFARVGVAMTRGRAVTRVGVIHPIESYWLLFGPNGTGDELGNRDRAFKELTEWLLYGLIDFDFIAESLLPKQNAGKQKGKTLQVGKCFYDAVIVPNLRTIRSTTLKILRKFAAAGGKVIIAGSQAQFIDAQSPTSIPTIQQSESISWGRQSVWTALDQYREIRVLTDQNVPTERLLHQIREDGNERFVFICNTDRNSPTNTTIHLKGSWKIIKLDTLSGDESVLQSEVKEGWTVFPNRFEGCASLLLRLQPLSPLELALVLQAAAEKEQSTAEIVLDSVTLAEPNVFMLDYAEYQMDDGEWSPRYEILQIDNNIRRRLNMPFKGSAWKQPWAVPESERAPKAKITTVFTFESFVDINDSSMLALEDAEKMVISVNEVLIPSSTKDQSGWWVDEAIKTVDIPPKTIKKGINKVSLTYPFGFLTNVERIYILGNFSVKVDGNTITMHPLNLKDVTWGNIVPQGLPFYVGNVIYNCHFSVPSHKELSSSTATLTVPTFSSPVLVVHDTETSNKLGRIAFQPHTLDLGQLSAGKHSISITAFGNRYNAFGHIHLVDGITDVCWPDMWRMGGGWWTDGYTVKPIGVLESPSVLIATSTSSASSEEMKPSRPARRVSDEWVVVRPRRQ